MRALLERLDPEYKKLLEEICPHICPIRACRRCCGCCSPSASRSAICISFSRSIAEIAPHVRRTEQIAEHVRMRMAQQICGDLAEGGVLKVLRLGNRWDLAFHESLKRDAKGEIVEFDIDPRLIEEFARRRRPRSRRRLEARRRVSCWSPRPMPAPMCA
jgi:flagellar biosynthesis protein FlhA